MNPPNAVLRLFVALDLPDSLQQQIAARCPARQDLSWTPAERLHLTLCFIGPTRAQDAPRIDTLLSAISFQPFTLEIERIGSFGQHHLWLGTAPDPNLGKLQADIQQALVAAQLIDTPHRAFVPHITVARIRSTDSRQLLKQLQGSLIGSPLQWEVDQFSLKNSLLTPTGALHQVLALYNASRVPV